MPITLNLTEILSVFASLKVNFDPSMNLNFSSAKPKHLKLLDGLALLAVTEGTHDVAAVTMTSHVEETESRTITKFHFMKNRDFTADEAEYLKNLCDLLNTCPPHRLGIRLHELVFPKCREKIHARLMKLAKTVKEFEKRIPEWNPPDKEDVDGFSAVYPTTPGANWPSILKDFLRNGLNPDRYYKSGDPGLILFQCQYFCKRGLLSCIGSQQLARRLGKVAQYGAIVFRLEKMAMQERKRRVFALNLLSCPPRTPQPAIDSALKLINKSAKALEPAMDEFKVKDVKSVTPSIVRDRDIDDDRQAAENFVHCECGLAVEMRKFTSQVLEIGVSKNRCWPCVQFLKEYARETNGFCLTASHEKTYHNWLFPLEITHSIYQKMMDEARKELTSLLMTLNGRRLSDSNIDSSPDEEEEEEDELHSLQQVIFNKLGKR